MDTHDSSAPPVPAVPWGAAEGVAVVCLFILVQSAFLALIARPGAGLAAHATVACLSDLAVLAFVAGLLVVSRGGSARHGRPTDLLGLVRPRGGCRRDVLAILMAGSAAYLGSMTFVRALYAYLGVDWWDIPRQLLGERIAEARDPATLALAFVAVVLVGPLAEEVVFRGVFYLPLRAAMGPIGAGLVVGAVFSVAHSYLPGVDRLFILSLVFTALFEATGSLWPAVIAHAAFNAAAFALLRLVPG